MDMILKRRLWAIHDEFFSIKPYFLALTIAEYDFLFMTIWVRVYKLPLRAMNRDIGLRLGGYVGTALGVDHRVEGGNMGAFLRILDQVDIRKPLRRCVLLNNSGGKQASPCPIRSPASSQHRYPAGPASPPQDLPHASETGQVTEKVTAAETLETRAQDPASETGKVTGKVPEAETLETRAREVLVLTSTIPIGPTTADTVVMLDGVAATAGGSQTTAPTEPKLHDLETDSQHAKRETREDGSVNALTHAASLVHTASSKSSATIMSLPRVSKQSLQGKYEHRHGLDYFRYDNYWAIESECVDKVHTAWSFTSGSAIDKLSAVGGALRH
ncbi:hypothetical protein V6N13_057448 [Hibiscus sabdariffa]